MVTELNPNAKEQFKTTRLYLEKHGVKHVDDLLPTRRLNEHDEGFDQDANESINPLFAPIPDTKSSIKFCSPYRWSLPHEGLVQDGENKQKYIIPTEFLGCDRFKSFSVAKDSEDKWKDSGTFDPVYVRW